MRIGWPISPLKVSTFNCENSIFYTGTSSLLSCFPHLLQAALADPGWSLGITSISLPAWGRVSIWDEAEIKEEEEEEEETVGTDKKVKKHTSKSAAKALRRAEEAAAEREEDRRLNAAAATPQTAAEFEQLVLASPNSSLVWVQYMAWQVQACQYAAARAVAARAVERISFREEAERLNVYLAWLNLENAFGSQESLNKVSREIVRSWSKNNVTGNARIRLKISSASFSLF